MTPGSAATKRWRTTPSGVASTQRYESSEKGRDCWTWTAATNGIEYGVIAGKSGRFLAHRLAYQLLVGPIPQGFDLDHLCRNPSCVNPAHLEAVSHAENVRRGMAPSAVRVREGRCHRGHPFTEANSRIRNGHRQCRPCQAQFARERRARLAAQRAAA